MALNFVSPMMLRNPNLWRWVLAVTSWRTLTLNNYGMAVASQMGNLDLCFKLKSGPKGKYHPWSRRRRIQGIKCACPAPWKNTTANQNQWGFNSNGTHYCRSCFCKKLKNVWGLFHCEEKSVFAGLKHLGECCWFPGGDQWCPGLLVCSSACFLCGKMLTDIQIIRSINTQASGRPSWCLVCSWPFILLAEDED